MSRLRKLEKNSQGDFSHGLQLVRQTAAADSGATAITLLPTDIDTITEDTSTGATNRFSCDGCRTFKVRAWCSTNAATANVDIKEYPYPGPFRTQNAKSANSAFLTRGRGNLICTIACTFSGSGCVNTNPVTGVATAGTTWYELSTASMTYQQDPRVRQLPTAASGATGEKIVLIDALGSQWIYPQVTALSAGTIIVAMQHVD